MKIRSRMSKLAYSKPKVGRFLRHSVYG